MTPSKATPKLTIAERLRESFNAARADKTIDIRIPGYEPPLYVTFKVLTDYAEVRSAIGDTIGRPGMTEADREMELAIRMLPLASVDSYVLEDGKRLALGFKLGVGLHDAIFGESETSPVTDPMAVMALFRDNTMALMSVFGQYNTWTEQSDAVAQDLILGE